MFCVFSISECQENFNSILRTRKQYTKRLVSMLLEVIWMHRILCRSSVCCFSLLLCLCLPKRMCSSVGTCLWKYVFIKSAAFSFKNWFLIWPLNGECSRKINTIYRSNIFAHFRQIDKLSKKSFETVVVFAINMSILYGFIFELMNHIFIVFLFRSRALYWIWLYI